MWLWNIGATGRRSSEERPTAGAQSRTQGPRAAVLPVNQELLEGRGRLTASVPCPSPRLNCSPHHAHSVLSPPAMAPLLTLFLVALVGLPLGKLMGPGV
ncbi:ly-6/neurotoxin-like protein 1 isoform X2 [Ailuropoda melanoleuca]|uniref:ly-6/neurotoxin-like protein 1 isoform X2 n=1 Tax=Ailuropoda melanoleuca TaxID=9646 RepID=UPI001494F570|nr:ly-6/neurotoxin-like protein 1 isoform X2 [Ailuropoda melanoleuca]